MKSFRVVFHLVILLTLIQGCSTGPYNSADDFTVILSGGWKIVSSEKVTAGGDVLSTAGFNTGDWISATIPSTVMAALIADGRYSDIFMGDNIDRIDTAIFRVPWWYRTEFDTEDASMTTELIFEGINYRANIWLNGRQIASADTLFGGFRIFRINISGGVVAGKNALAVEVFHQRKDEPSIGFVDWAPMAPDREMGLWRPVKLVTSGRVKLENAFVTSKIDKDKFKSATLTITAEVVNNTGNELKTIVSGRIGDIEFKKDVALKPHERKPVEFSAAEFPGLKIENPRIWWTHDMGKPELYTLELSAADGNKVTHALTTRFGIREVEDYINAYGHRGYRLNGVPVLIRGGGWVDGMFLNDTEQKVKAQMEYAIHANMNTIRLEGFWGNGERFYELADELGLLLMAGWSCQWEWEGYLAKPEEEDFMSIRTPEDIKLIVNYTRDHVLWLRNHPSIFVWVMGSDKLPRPELEVKYDSLFALLDNSRPLLMSCKEHNSTVSGKTAVKMRGPYEYVSPNYWYIDSLNGGAFGFNSETGPGPQVPSLEVLKTMIPEDKLWPVNEIWNFHCGRNEFQTIERYDKAFTARYGKQDNVDDYTFKSQASNLEAMRAMFEAFAINREKTTGLIQWMYNSAWPKLIWQLWDYNLVPNGAFYGARIGARNKNIAYNYGDNSVYIVNLTQKELKSHSASVRIFNSDGKLAAEENLEAGVRPDASKKILTLPEPERFGEIFFLDLRLSNEEGKEIARNFYWLSRKEDVPDFPATEWFYTPLKEYADFTSLDKIEKVKIESGVIFKDEGEFIEVKAELRNNSPKIAFLIELAVTGEKSGKTIVPVFWDDNYISLLPGETRIVKGKFPVKALGEGDKPAFRTRGWNTIGF